MLPRFLSPSACIVEGMEGVQLGHLENLRFDEEVGAVVGELVLHDGPAGRWADEFLSSLEAQGRLHRVGLAADVDVELEGENVKRFVRVHAVTLVVRPAAGGRIRGRTGRETTSKRKGDALVSGPDARSLVAAVGPPPRGVVILGDPPRPPTTQNPDGTWRLLQYMPLAPDPHASKRFQRIARTLRDSNEYGAVVAGDAFDRFDKIARVVKDTATLDRRDPQAEIREYHRLGVPEEATAVKAVGRHLDRARKAESPEALIEDADEQPDRRPSPRTVAEIREIRDIIDDLRETDPAAYAEALYQSERGAARRGPHAGQSRREHAQRHGVTAEAMRASLPRLRRRLARFGRGA